MILNSALATCSDVKPDTPYRYISPLPYSTGHNIETILIIRFGPELDRSSIHRGIVSLHGEKSGDHEINFRLAEDNRTIQILPCRHFDWNESVTFRLDGGINTRDGNAVPPLEFSFGIRESPSRIPDLFRNDLNKSDLMVPEVQVLENDGSAPGYIFAAFNGLNSGILFTFDNNGTAVFYRKFPYNVNNFKLHPGGIPAYHDYGLDAFVGLDNFCQPLDTFMMANGYMANMHEFRLLENGHALMLAYDYRQMDLSEIIEGGDSNALVIGFVIQELDENKDLIFQWRSWDHLDIQDTYEECKSEFLNRFTICDFAHANSLDMDSDTSLLISTRNLSEITRINRQTGRIIWRMGGKNNEFDFQDDARSFRGQHTVSKQENGTITLFDNGYNSDSLYSRGLEYRVDEEKKTVSLVKEYLHDPLIYGFAMGNIQRLKNGNTLLYWGAKPDQSSGPVTEYDPGGRIVFEAEFEQVILPSYRCYRYEWNPGVFSLDIDTLYLVRSQYGQVATASVGIRNNTVDPVIINKLISPKGIISPGKNLPIVIPGNESRNIELYFQSDSEGSYRDVLTFCYDTDTSRVSVQLPVRAEVLALNDFKLSGVPGLRLKPMPVSDLLEISSAIPIHRLELYDSHGRLVCSGSGDWLHISLPLESVSTGFYLLKLKYRDGSISMSRILKFQ